MFTRKGRALREDSFMLKRAFDIAAACLGLLLASPILVGVALALKIQGGGPVFYWSPRVGRGGRIFRLARFRTMTDALSDADPEARLTSVGRFIRTYSLDDLPSLLCWS
ncbi:MAG TPA: sugar transferase [Ktedonobacterales bacterium]|nr:sugar transferase [Ktedonobacterales bacterium]